MVGVQKDSPRRRWQIWAPTRARDCLVHGYDRTASDGDWTKVGDLGFAPYWRWRLDPRVSRRGAWAARERCPGRRSAQNVAGTCHLTESGIRRVRLPHMSRRGAPDNVSAQPPTSFRAPQGEAYARGLAAC